MFGITDTLADTAIELVKDMDCLKAENAALKAEVASLRNKQQRYVSALEILEEFGCCYEVGNVRHELRWRIEQERLNAGDNTST